MLGVKSANTPYTMGNKSTRTPQTMGIKTHLVGKRPVAVNKTSADTVVDHETADQFDAIYMPTKTNKKSSLEK